MLCRQWVTDQRHSGSTRGLMGALGLDHLLEPGEGNRLCAVTLGGTDPAFRGNQKREKKPMRKFLQKGSGALLR